LAIDEERLKSGMRYHYISIVGSTGAEIGLIERNKVQNPSFYLIDAIADYFGVDATILVYTDLRNLDLLQVKILRAKRNLEYLEQNELRTFLAMTEELNQLEVEQGFFRSHNRHKPNTT